MNNLGWRDKERNKTYFYHLTSELFFFHLVQRKDEFQYLKLVPVTLSNELNYSFMYSVEHRGFHSLFTRDLFKSFLQFLPVTKVLQL